MLLSIQIKIEAKAKNKADGCFRCDGIAYRVKDGIVTHFADHGTIIQSFAGWNVNVGSYEYGLDSDITGQKLLKQL